MPMVTGGEAIVDALLTHGIDTVFGLPGAQIYGLFDALHRAQPRLRVLGARLAARRRAAASMRSESTGGGASGPSGAAAATSARCVNTSQGISRAAGPGRPDVIARNS